MPLNTHFVAELVQSMPNVFMKIQCGVIHDVFDQRSIETCFEIA